MVKIVYCTILLLFTSNLYSQYINIRDVHSDVHLKKYEKNLRKIISKQIKNIEQDSLIFTHEFEVRYSGLLVKDQIKGSYFLNYILPITIIDNEETKLGNVFLMYSTVIFDSQYRFLGFCYGDKVIISKKELSRYTNNMIEFIRKNKIKTLFSEWAIKFAINQNNEVLVYDTLNGEIDTIYTMDQYIDCCWTNFFK